LSGQGFLLGNFELGLTGEVLDIVRLEVSVLEVLEKDLTWLFSLYSYANSTVFLLLMKYEKLR
jgi:hypothetical protein